MQIVQIEFLECSQALELYLTTLSSKVKESWFV